ncbi:TIGR04423 family type III CRISPR-associated protein [Aliarcobacter skirrowii]|uniref:TIGR04423 family type III CRISPR-associated protein n=1 Tax=Aliarcobacter skirrowii TaxID=28200 RepID=UPI000D607BED|nr:TIGR04423 family type III CRISPR-associated protein [Aliarcobacter skirrowii]PWE19398.1 TIGR04423 family type III CRISPR-associated protein [Aliarcobacter skirrowii]PWE25909.1 TIGR04423 family type III CRISPR-associated protein [Aliarcobacter skirrowii]RJO55286.1 TIGR04423 family type III CRISPR-associated protein [Aliarcobacter skirrowii]RJO57167.1 TIGR04423 family type III CRISPR-associated protein [Aliarcobacter skirrowii]
MKTYEEIKNFYINLEGKFEGYFQMSDEKLNKVYQEKQSLPSWEDLHEDKNFILEACLFDGNRSITIRNIGNSFVLIDKNISDFKEENITKQSFITNGYKEVIISQIWEEKEDENCLNIKVLKPTIQLFSGFEKGENK